MDGRPNDGNNAAYSNFSGVVSFTGNGLKCYTLLKIDNSEIIITPSVGIG